MEFSRHSHSSSSAPRVSSAAPRFQKFGMLFLLSVQVVVLVKYGIQFVYPVRRGIAIV